MRNFLREWGWPAMVATLLYTGIVAVGWFPVSWAGDWLSTFAQDVHTIADSIENEDTTDENN